MSAISYKLLLKQNQAADIYKHTTRTSCQQYKLSRLNEINTREGETLD